ncbi:hypothetical protein [Streptomyces maremycinicus]|uniref:hypothetical protein n=1 Tax=Streptomyces maremycinicus TaxID=1679753 RepID=UPI00078748AF|nr:hypothetical protein [Streptomyces sp. NBRC 110468]
MRSPTRARGRRGASLGASAAAVVVAAGLLAGCGGDGHTGGYVAIGGAGDTAFPDPRTGGSADPTGGVRLVPLDDESGSPAGRAGRPGGPAGETAAGPAGEGSGDTTGGATGPGAARSAAPGLPGSSGTSDASPAPGTGGGDATGGTPPDGPSPPPTPTAPSSTVPAGPAALVVGAPVRAGTDQRWCENVTLTFRNSGGSVVRSGTVTFGTHVIDAIGVDWATRESTAALPTPIAAGARQERTWTVCVDAWRVPLGMHIETRDVSVRWE